MSLLLRYALCLFLHPGEQFLRCLGLGLPPERKWALDDPQSEERLFYEGDGAPVVEFDELARMRPGPEDLLKTIRVWIPPVSRPKEELVTLCHTFGERLAPKETTPPRLG